MNTWSGKLCAHIHCKRPRPAEASDIQPRWPSGLHRRDWRSIEDVEFDGVTLSVGDFASLKDATDLSD
jgi:hypothetical protein